MSLQPDSQDLNANLDKVSVTLECENENNDIELECLGTQIGGHSSRLEKYKKTKLGIYDLKNGFILKTLFPPPRGPRELKFYQNVFSSECHDSDLLELRPFIPTFYGTEEKFNTQMMKLTNLTASFEKPCVMDVKMGRVTYDQEASAEKIHCEQIKFPPLKKTGFQITGMIIQTQAEKEVIDKHYTRSLSEKTLVTDGLGVFFSILSDNVKKQVIHGLISKLKKLENWFLRQKKFSFVASSLLFIYEGKNGKAILRPFVNKNTDLASDNSERSSNCSSETDLPSESSITRKRSHDNDENGKNPICDGGEKSKCSFSHKIPKGENEACRNSKSLQEDSSENRGGSLPPLLNSVTSGPGGDHCLADTGEVVPEFSVHLIDFAHVFPSSNVDENFLFGLQKLISSLLALIE